MCLRAINEWVDNILILHVVLKWINENLLGVIHNKYFKRIFINIDKERQLTDKNQLSEEEIDKILDLGEKRKKKFIRKRYLICILFFIKSILQTTMTMIMLNRYGLIMVHDMSCDLNERYCEDDAAYYGKYDTKYHPNYNWFDENRYWLVKELNNGEMIIPTSFAEHVLDKLTIMPRKFQYSPNEMFYNEINGNLNLFDIINELRDNEFSYPYDRLRIPKNYKGVSCNISFYWDNIDCDEKCLDVMTQYENQQKNGDVLMCYYEIEYDAWWHHLQIGIIYILIYGYAQFWNFEQAEEDALELYYWDMKVFKIFHYTESTYGYLNDKEYKRFKRLFRFCLTIYDTFFVLFINFIWCDLLTWAFTPVDNSMNLYRNILLSNDFEVEDGNLSYIKKMNINIPNCLTFAIGWGTSWVFFFMFWTLIPAKIIFSIANMFSVFSVGFLNINICFKTIRNFFTFEYTTHFFTPQFWYYFNILIYPILLNYIMDIDEYYDSIKSQCVSMKEWVCDKMKKTELPTIELPEISVETKEETQEVNENELQIEIREESI